MSTLSARGAKIASAPQYRSLLTQISDDQYNANTNPRGFVNMGAAENYTMLSSIATFMKSHPISMAEHEFSYNEGPWGTKRLRNAFAQHMNRRFHPLVRVSEQDVFVVNGVSTVCDMLGFALTEPGDGILMGRPLYQSFVQDFGTKAEATPVHVSFGQVDQFSPAAVACYEEALQDAEKRGTRVRALLLCHPHNPLGQCYPRESIIELMKLCSKYNLHLLSDEIYAMSVYEVPNKHAVPFESVLAFDSSKYINKDYLHVMYGMSKDLAAGGLRIGCMYTRNEDLQKAFSALNQFNWPGIADQLIASEVLEDDAWLDEFFKTSRSRLAHCNKLTRNLLDGKGIEYHKGANAGFFVWVDLSPFLSSTGKVGWEAEAELMKWCIDKKVLITNGGMLNAEEPGFFRIIISHDEDIVREGLKRVFEIVGV